MKVPVITATKMPSNSHVVKNVNIIQKLSKNPEACGSLNTDLQMTS